MKHVMIGTAGHIDHGKTALVKALTGTDTDRLAEEKRRGITIDLGFAQMVLPGGTLAGIVDVPGHEKFIRNMLAGAGAIDLALMVVAADEGVMPQTREHLDILTLLGVQHGVVALTKCDLVDEETLELAKEDLREAFAGSFLQKAPVVEVSAVTGMGISALREALLLAVGKCPERGSGRPFRMPVDRVFTVDGFGTVVTGTVLGGTLSVGD
ncbi:MAG: selenocysteine-specific translation elongation factor, partial [Anaerotruncus rubiinfantis]